MSLLSIVVVALCHVSDIISFSLGPPNGTLGTIDWRYPDEVVISTPACEAEGTFSHPTYENYYYRCHETTENDGSFRRFLFTCEEGTQFSNTLDQCVNGSEAPTSEEATTNPPSATDTCPLMQITLVGSINRTRCKNGIIQMMSDAVCMGQLELPGCPDNMRFNLISEKCEIPCQECFVDFPLGGCFSGVCKNVNLTICPEALDYCGEDVPQPTCPTPGSFYSPDMEDCVTGCESPCLVEEETCYLHTCSDEKEYNLCPKATRLCPPEIRFSPACDNGTYDKVSGKCMTGCEMNCNPQELITNVCQNIYCKETLETMNICFSAREVCQDGSKHDHCSGVEKYNNDTGSCGNYCSDYSCEVQEGECAEVKCINSSTRQICKDAEVMCRSSGTVESVCERGMVYDKILGSCVECIEEPASRSEIDIIELSSPSNIECKYEGEQHLDLSTCHSMTVCTDSNEPIEVEVCETRYDCYMGNDGSMSVHMVRCTDNDIFSKHTKMCIPMSTGDCTNDHLNKIQRSRLVA